jgi:hypothetical protein
VALAGLGGLPSTASARRHHRVSVSVVKWVTDQVVAGTDVTQDAVPASMVPICLQKPMFAVGVSYAVQGHPQLRTGISIKWTGPGGLATSFNHHVADLIRGPLAINVRAESRTPDQGLLPGTYQASVVSAGAVVSTSSLTLVPAQSC